MEDKLFVIGITGSAGNIGSSLLFDIFKAKLVDDSKQIELRLFDLPTRTEYQQGLLLELEDSFPKQFSSAKLCEEKSENFQGIDLLIMLSGKPRIHGQERKDLIGVNVQLFRKLGQMINPVAKPSMKVLVVANPCNTNAYVFSLYASNIPKKNIQSLSRLDLNRALAFITSNPKISAFRESIDNVGIFGNHSRLVYMDISKCTILKDGRTVKVDSLLSAQEVQEIRKKLETRGMEILKKTGKSAGESASTAIIDHIRDWLWGNPKMVCAGVYCEKLGDVSYDCYVSLPMKFHASSDPEIIEDYISSLGEESQTAFKSALDELQKEKHIALSVLNHLDKGDIKDPN